MQNELNELRNQVRTLKRVVYGACGLLLVGGLLAATSLQSVPDVLRAKKFEVVNDEGKAVAKIFVDAGGGMLALGNKDGRPVAVIGANAIGMGKVVLSNKDGERVAVLGASVDGMGGLVIYNKDGKHVAVITAGDDGMGMLGIDNKDGKRVAGIYADAIGDGAITTHNSKGQITSKSP